MKHNWTKTLYLVRGFFGEGKSTLASLLVDGNKDQIVENDDYWIVDGNYQYDASLKHVAGWWCWAEIFRKFRSHDTIAVPNAFIKKEQLMGYIQEAQSQEILVYIVRANSFLNPYDSRKRATHGAIPDETIQYMIDSWEEFTEEEIAYWSTRNVIFIDHQVEMDEGRIQWTNLKIQSTTTKLV